ncbi:M20/M25/M40 family metallo-hydrolase [Photobacterium damselae subsp. damselae]|uniref:M20/M25/M40 family metallo-hydrolase n=1 Tax=Photobacterium damselae subsp. damselae TaxID=85581 RepID=A0A850QLV5_PHODD|nr:M20/M25/M40 family metallo-hydrolase [Photobacterium damselae subsp. damselae]
MIEHFITQHLVQFHDDLKRITLTAAPTFDESRRVALIQDMLTQWDYDSHIDDVGNLICFVKGEVREQVVYSAHVDTVFPLNTELNYIEQDGFIHCPGVADNSLAVTSLIYVMKYLREYAITPHFDTYFVFNVCEEGLGNLHGIKHFIDTTPLPNLKVHFALEGNKLNRLTSTFVGSIRKKVAIKGLGGHSWRDYGNTSAVQVAANIISQLYDIALPQTSKTTLNVGKLQGGTGVNVIPQYAEILFEVRFVDQQEGLRVMDEALSIINAFHRDQITIDIETIGDRPAGQTHNPEVVATIKAVHQSLGINTDEDIGSTDSNYPASKGLSSFTLGLSNAKNLHALEEFVEIPPMQTGLHQLIKIVETLR